MTSRPLLRPARSRSLAAVLTLIPILSVVSCSGSGMVWQTDSGIEDSFAAAGVEGVFVMHKLGTRAYTTNDRARAETRYLPASTFKIFNALVALETGVVADEHEVIPWDGTERGVPAWNRDHDLASGIRVSAVWYFQELARRIGRERMQHWIDAVGYGNGDIGGDLDAFWLTGNIRISPIEQVDFLERLYRNALPFSERSMQIVRDILFLEQADGWILRGKTGWGSVGEDQVGWFVGYVERETGVWFFANNIAITNDDDVRARVEVAKNVLAAKGIIGR